MSLRRKLLAFLHNRKKTAEYTELAYLESTGTQWIDTGVVGTENISIETGFEFTTTDVQYLFGSSVTYNTNTFCFSLNPSSGKLYRAFIGATTGTVGNTGEVFSTKMSVNKAYFSTTQIRLDDEVYDITTTVPFTTPTSMYLFAKSNNGKADFFGKVKVKFFKIYDKGVLVLDLLPVLDKDLVPCMYDKITGKFFYNQGDGEFKWKLPNQLECLESDGGQYLLTDYYPNPNTAAEVDYFPNPSSVFNCIYGTQSNGNTNRFYALISSINYKLQISSTNVSNYYGLDGVGGLIYNGQGFTTSQIRVVLTVDNYNKLIRTVTDDGTVNYDMNQYSELGSPDCHYPLVIFNRSTAGVITATNGYKGRIYSFKIWESDKLIHYYIPVFDEDLTPCMYDLVSKQYLRNQGTGAFKGYFTDGSQLVSYLESDGNQWIDTGFIPNENHKIEVVGYSSKVNTGVSLVGTRNASDYNNRLQIWSDTSGYFSARINASTFVTIHPSTVKSTIVLDIKNKDFTVNDSEAYSLNYTGSLATNNYFLFLRNNGSGGVDTNYADPVVIYSFKLWDNDNLVQYLLPVVDSDGVACMYDVVTEKLSVKQGTGSFTYGTVVEITNHGG